MYARPLDRFTLYAKKATVCSLGLAVALGIAFPSCAAPKGVARKPSADRQTKASKPKRPVTPALSSEAGGAVPQPSKTDEEATAEVMTPPVVAASTQGASTPPTTSSAPTVLASAPVPQAPPPVPEPDPQPSATAPAVPAANPYLAGWFRPTPSAELPQLAARQLASNAQWIYASVVSLPGKVVDSLPSVKRVFPTGGRELWVANIKCPAEMVAGQYFIPANALRDAVNGVLGTINELRLLAFDIQLVCS